MIKTTNFRFVVFILLGKEGIANSHGYSLRSFRACEYLIPFVTTRSSVLRTG
jgi:hypothetical protein